MVRIRRRLKEDVWPTVFNVREKLGDVYATDPADPVIQSFIDRRKAQVQELAGETWTTDPPEAIFSWVLNYACADVLFQDLTGKDAGTALKYKIGDMSTDKSSNTQLKTTLMNTLIAEAVELFESWQAKQITYYKGGASTFYARGSP